jgi:inner membrane transporter RhtA
MITPKALCRHGSPTPSQPGVGHSAGKNNPFAMSAMAFHPLKRPPLNLRLWAMLALLGSLVSLAVGTSFAKSLFPALGAEGTTAYRLVFAMLMLMAVFRPWRRQWVWADALPLCLYGVTLGVMNLLFYSAIKTIPFGVAIAIEFTGPLAVAVWTSKKPSDWLWVALAVWGLGLLLPLPGAHAATALDPWGMGLALAAGVCWALYIVFGQRVALRYGSLATPMGMLAASLVVAPIGVLHAGSALLNPSFLLAGLTVALMSSAIPYALEMFALHHLPKNTFSILLSLEPAVGALAGWLVLSEHLTWLQGLAITLVMAASMGTAWSAGRTASKRD